MKEIIISLWEQKIIITKISETEQFEKENKFIWWNISYTLAKHIINEIIHQYHKGEKSFQYEMIQDLYSKSISKVDQEIKSFYDNITNEDILNQYLSYTYLMPNYEESYNKFIDLNKPIKIKYNHTWLKYITKYLWYDELILEYENRLKNIIIYKNGSCKFTDKILHQKIVDLWIKYLKEKWAKYTQIIEKIDK